MSPRRLRRRNAFVLVALLALAALGNVLVQEAFVHTDDGCAVELHCLACRLSVAGTTVLSPTLILTPVATAVELPSTPAFRVPRKVARHVFRTRAPPLA
jgi:hypothetical protein